MDRCIRPKGGGGKEGKWQRRMPINCISSELIDQILKKFRETLSFDPATFRATRLPPFQAQQRVNRIPALSTAWTQSSNFGCSSKATDTPASPKGLGRARNFASLSPSPPLSLSLPLTSLLPGILLEKDLVGNDDARWCGGAGCVRGLTRPCDPFPQPGSRC